MTCIVNVKETLNYLSNIDELIISTIRYFQTVILMFTISLDRFSFHSDKSFLKTQNVFVLR